MLADRARVRAQRRAHRGPLDDRHGRRHQPLVPLRPDLPRDARAASSSAAARASTAAAGRTTSARRRSAPITGWQTLAFALDWTRPPRQQPATSFWYLATDQWRYERFGADELTSPLGTGAATGKHFADANALGARLGWLPSLPDASTATRSTSATRRRRRASSRPSTSSSELTSGRLRFACEDPDEPGELPAGPDAVAGEPARAPRARATSTSCATCSASTDAAVRAEETPPEQRPTDVAWHDEAPTGKLDLFTTIDFRMNGSALYSDIVLPAATWYEKHDISSTDLHPFVHPFNARSRRRGRRETDWDAFNGSREFPRAGREHLGDAHATSSPRRCCTTRPDELAQPLRRGARLAARASASRSPGKTMPKLIVVERDYTRRARQDDRARAAGREAGIGGQGRLLEARRRRSRSCAARNGVVRGGVGRRAPVAERVDMPAETILALSGTTNGRLAVEGFRSLEQRTGAPLADIAERPRGRPHHVRADTQSSRARSSPRPSGRASSRATAATRPSPPTSSAPIPWRTLTGRQHFYLDHEWMLDLGEGLPAYRPPVDAARIFGDEGARRPARPEVTVRYLTPHSKWSIHSEFQDNLHMLTLFRGGPAMWLEPRGRRADRRRRQRLARGLQPQRRRRLPRRVSHRIPRGHVRSCTTRRTAT